MKTQWQSTTERKLRRYGSPDAGLYGGTGWSRTTVLGFSDRRANRVRHRPILSEHRAPLHDRTHPQQESLFQFLCLYLSISDFLLQGTNLFCKMLDLNQLPIVYQTIALPYELISLQKLIAVRAFIYNKQKRKENHYDSWLRGVGLEPTIFGLWGRWVTISLPRNGCSRRIRTSYPGYEPGVLPLDDHCNI